MPEFYKCYEYWYDGTIQDSLHVEKYYNPIKKYDLNAVIIGGYKGGALLGTPLPDWFFRKQWSIGVLPVTGRTDMPVKYCYISATTTGNPKLIVCDDNIKNKVVGALVVFRLVPGYKGSCSMFGGSDADVLLVADTINSPSGTRGKGDQLISIVRDEVFVARTQKPCKWLEYCFQNKVSMVSRIFWDKEKQELIAEERPSEEIVEYDLDDVSVDGKEE